MTSVPAPDEALIRNESTLDHCRYSRSLAVETLVLPRALHLSLNRNVFRFVGRRCPRRAKSSGGVVLHQQHDVALRYSFVSRINVWLQDFVRRDAVVVEESIRRFHFRTFAGGGGNAEIRICSEFFHKLPQSGVESLVTEVSRKNFIFESDRIPRLQLSCHAQNSTRALNAFDITLSIAQRSLHAFLA